MASAIRTSFIFPFHFSCLIILVSASIIVLNWKYTVSLIKRLSVNIYTRDYKVPGKKCIYKLGQFKIVRTGRNIVCWRICASFKEIESKGFTVFFVGQTRCILKQDLVECSHWSPVFFMDLHSKKTQLPFHKPWRII
jgi:hypothetical protein